MPLTPSPQDARNEFEAAESESDPGVKLEALTEALALVDEVLDEEGVAEQEKAVMRNVRRTYLRRLLQQTMAMSNVQFSDWFAYMRLLLVDQQPVVSEILASEPALRAAFDRFLGLYGDKFREALGQDIRTFVGGAG
jgi:hypothetical protein